MCKISFMVAIVLVTICGIVVEARRQNETRCFQFSWLGPRFHNDSIFRNATCRDRTKLASGIPCEEPLVVSFDGTWPDVEYIWTHYPDASCELVDNDVCAQITYTFNGLVENSTYMCTRAVDANNTAITSGCYEETHGSSSMKVCVCRSAPGVMPCNSATNLSITLFAYIVLVLTIIFNKPSVWFSALSSIK